MHTLIHCKDINLKNNIIINVPTRILSFGLATLGVCVLTVLLAQIIQVQARIKMYTTNLLIYC